MLFKQTMAYLPSQAVSIVIQIAALLVWTHWLSAPELGLFTLMVALQEIVFAPSMVWWSGYMRRYLTRFEDDAARRRFDGTDRVLVFWASIAQVALVAIAAPIMTTGPATPALLAAAVAFSLTRGFAVHVSNRALAEGRPIIFTIVQAGGQVLGLCLGVVALALVDSRAEVLLAAYGVAQAMALMLAFPALAHFVRPLPFDRGILKEAASYGWPLVVGAGVGWIGFNAIRFLVDMELGAAAVGLLATGWTLGLKAAAVSSMLVAVPSFMLAVERGRKHGHSGALEQMGQNAALLLAILAPMAAGLAMVAGPVTELLVAEPFRQATTAILPIAVAAGAVSAFQSHFSDQAFLLFERTRVITWLGLFEAVSTIVGCYLGLMLGGFIGAAIGCLAADVVHFIVSFSLARRLFGIYLPLGDVARILTATAVMCAVVTVIPAQGTHLGLAIQIGTGALTYGLVLLGLFRASLRLPVGLRRSGAGSA